MEKTKEIVIDLSEIRYLYVFFKLLIEKLELPEITGMTVDSLSDFLREPWEEDWHVKFIGVSKTNDDIRQELSLVLEMFDRVKEFQKRANNEFTWEIEQ